VLTRSCCCQGCFEVDDCPLPYGGLGDFTYTATIDIGQVLGTFSNVVITAITPEFVLDPQQCYASAFERDKCCFTGFPTCSAPTDTLVEKYYDVMALGRVEVERTYFKCFVVLRRPDALPRIVKKIRCSQPKTISYNACDYTYPVQCSDLFPDCYQGPAPNYLTQLTQFQSPYALRLDNSANCGDVSYEFDDQYQFGPLTKGGGDIRMRRNGLTTFTVDQTSGANLSSMTYLHRANICPGGQQTDCGPCTLGGNGGTLCAEGRCCCRSLLDVSILVRREYYRNDFAWSAVANDFVVNAAGPFYETQTLRLIYEGPVDERLYRVVGTPAQRTFTLLRGSITGSFLLNAGVGIDVQTLSYCPRDLYGLPGTVNTSNETLGTTVDDYLVTDECEPCESPTPPSPDLLSMEQLEQLGISRTLIVTRTSP
jgi:hypothetical protein